MKERKVGQQVQGFRTQDGAGVKLVRVLGHETTYDFDPFLMLDSFDSTNQKDFEAGFPEHPHRGIETVSFIAKGRMTHEDHLGSKETIHDGEAQWLTAGSGAYHSEMPGGERLLGLQLWLNLPAKDKMKASPAYHGILKEEIQEFPFDGGKLRLITGEYQGHKGWQGKYLPLDYYDIHLEPNARLTVDVKEQNTVMLFTLLGDIVTAGTHIDEKTAVKMLDGDKVIIEAGANGAQVMLMSAPPLKEPIAWNGPIVMNTQAELRQAVNEIYHGGFIKEVTKY